MNPHEYPEYKRPLSVAHLVFALIFGGIAAVWFLGHATDADLPSSAVGFPVVLIGAGVIGLIASLAGSRRRSQIAAAAQAEARAAYDAYYATPAEPATDPAPAADPDPAEDTVVLEAPAAPETTTEEKS